MFNENRFKFRIYDKETKEMFYFKLGEKLFFPNFDTFFEQNPQKILMQCTGLTDKNGELIYEGDIIQAKLNYVKNNTHTDEIVGICKYFACRFGLSVLTNPHQRFNDFYNFHNIEIIK